LLHQGDWITTEEIANEVRAIKTLCGSGTHANIVEVFRLGELVDTSYYFIDMELCDLTLESYIYPNMATPVDETIPHFVSDTSPSLQAMQLWNITKQIITGVAYIHSHNEVHRDLKPSNGINPVRNKWGLTL